YIISISSSNTNYSDIQLSANQSLHFKIRSTEQSLSVAYSVPDLNRWYFVSAVLDESNMEISLYVNGILKSNLGISGATILNPTGSSLRFGHNTHNCTNSYFEGSIDEVKIYNYARTPQQIIEDMQAGQPAVNSPIGHWKFDEEYWSGEAEEVKDSSGFNNHASASLGTTTPASGIKGKAGSFNGVDSGIQLPKSSSMSTRESYTVSSWINLANLVGTSHILQIAPSATTTGNIG